MSEPVLTISPLTRRRFVLGRQGLWPGRRWSGAAGVVDAIRTMEALQLDPLNIVARSQEIALYGRVLGFSPQHLDAAVYQERRFFDYGGSLFLYPIEELPYWRLHMRRKQEKVYWRDLAAAHAGTLEQVRRELAERGPLGNRDFDGNQRVHSYRGRKDTALVLYYLWITGEVMIHHRNGFDRVYDLANRVAPPELQFAVPDEQAEAFFARKAIAFVGLTRERPWITSLADYIQRPLAVTEGRAWLQRLVDEGQVLAVRVEGEKDLHYLLAEDLPLLQTLQAGGVPSGWEPQGPSTLEEAVLLAPLEIASARGRAKKLFGFDYVWEVYKPVEQRRWGYYTLPVLYGDRLLARLDSRLDRKTMTLQVLGFWLEPDAPAGDPAFAAALRAGLQRFAAFVRATSIDLSALDNTYRPLLG